MQTAVLLASRRKMVTPAAVLSAKSLGRRCAPPRCTEVLSSFPRLGRFRCYSSSQSRHQGSSSSSIRKSPAAVIPATNWPLSEFSTSKACWTPDFSKPPTDRFQSLSSLAAPSSTSFDDPDLFSDISFDSLLDSAAQQPTPLRLADMYKYGRGTDMAQRIRNAQFLYKELPIRIAQRAVDLLTLPHGLSEAEPIRQVVASYLRYLNGFRTVPLPTTVEEEEAFTDMLQKFILDRTSIPTSIARGVQVWRQQQQQQDQDSSQEEHDMEEALYRFFTARVGLRFLTEHHVLSSARPSTQALRRNVTSMFSSPTQQEHDLGCIQTNCDVVQEVRHVADLVQRQTVEYYSLGFEHDTDKQCCPKIEIVDCNPQQGDFTYVPHHLHYMMAELLKNSVRATIRHYELLLASSQSLKDDKKMMDQDFDGKLPPIRVIIAKGDEDVTIKICDRGGGIPRSSMQTIWKFAHSTASEKELECDFGKDVVSGARMRGFGLPLARIYARYFGGELTLKSTEGWGLDAYLYLPRLGESCENLPLRVRDSPGERDSMPSSLYEA